MKHASKINPYSETSVAFLDPQSTNGLQGGSRPPNVHFQANPTDRYGVAVARMSYDDGTCLSGVPTDHLIGIVCSKLVVTDHMMAGARLQFEAGLGSLCICPMGADYVADFRGPIDGYVLQISSECLTLAKSQFDLYSSVLVECMNGRDDILFRMSRALEAEAAAGHPNGMLFWNSITDEIIRHLALNHLSKSKAVSQGVVSDVALKLLDEYVEENLGENLDLATLSDVVGCDRFHFAHRFRAKLGMSPHRYVVRRRLERALALIKDRRDTLAEIAIATGFCDQSHLSNWFRRIYGTTPGRLHV